MPARSVIFRLLAAAPLCALCACATTAPAEAELGALRAELRTLRASQERLKERVERLEAHDTVARAGSASDSGAARPIPVKVEAAPAVALDATPELAVVKLKPRHDPAPRLPTAVAVTEPDDEQMEMFISPVADDASSGSASGAATMVASSDDSAGEEKDPDLLELEFDQGVSMLRTGNVEGGVERLARFAQANPRHPRADNALYFSGLGQIGLNDFKQAAKTFQRLIDSYPAGDAMLDGMLRLAECRMRLNQAADAKVLYTRVVTQFPGTAAATQAEQRLAALPQ
ncbi:TPR repeat containing exported protein [Myxococcus hansupus]|uniref:TPR repeat containing exported protein n=1 Tax=Pseudomyxococcus hansupus TaxID=1297742 RepID=A0A0H4WWB4_9BACT|nr:tetratricopeptide repeat protein [Myxococcus hansupus]AKQ67099.1 TPR repeat containing exported protein [Myxococcus hansupus]